MLHPNLPPEPPLIISGLLVPYVTTPEHLHNLDNLALLSTLSSFPQPEVLPAKFSLSKNSDLDPAIYHSDHSGAKGHSRRREKVTSVVLHQQGTQLISINVPAAASPDKSNDQSNLSQLIDGSTPISLPIENVIEFNSRTQAPESSTPATLKFRSANPPSNLPKTQHSFGETPAIRERVMEVIADRQEYDQENHVVTAEGHAVVRFDRALLEADRVQVNLDNLISVGSGNVSLTRGDQVLRGETFSYNFIQDSGDLTHGRGEIYIPTSQLDLNFTPSEITANTVPSYPLSDRIRANQPLTGINSPGGIQFNLGGNSGASNIPVPKSGGVVKRFRFEADHIDFYPRGWTAKNVRITNDPFSPPELELRASQATLTREAPLIDRITTQNQRLVLDQNTTLPIPIDNRKIDRRPKQVNPTIVNVGFDGNQRGGFFVERSFEPINQNKFQWSFTPQFFVERAIQSPGDVPALFGIKSRLNAVLGPKTTIQGSGELTSFDLTQVDNNLKASLRLHQLLGDVKPYTLNLEYSYRNLLYNGSLGFQTVQSSLGGVILSPRIPLGKSGITLTYQAGAQYINANTDRQDLLTAQGQTNGRISLGRLQGSFSLSRGFPLWSQKPLPPTREQGLHYTSNPVVPYLQLVSGLTGTSSYYTSGDNQSTLTGSIGLVGQIGHFSRKYLDYTAFSIIYSQGLNTGSSPFLFDRSVDNRVLNYGVTQQIYGPIRLGFQIATNLDTGVATSIDYLVEYSRRTYGIVFRYNPVLQFGGVSIRISDFNWTGGTDPFSDGSFKPVVGGVIQP